MIRDHSVKTLQATPVTESVPRDVSWGSRKKGHISGYKTACPLTVPSVHDFSGFFFFIPNRHIHSISAKEFILLFWTHQTDTHSNAWEITRRTKAKTYSVFCWMFELIRRKETVSFGGGGLWNIGTRLKTAITASQSQTRASADSENTHVLHWQLRTQVTSDKFCDISKAQFLHLWNGSYNNP